MKKLAHTAFDFVMEEITPILVKATKEAIRFAVNHILEAFMAKMQVITEDTLAMIKAAVMARFAVPA